tara:strand:- start:1465 stop:1893 length:429 start_codon:yes stop_codon:yes gene_type:complete
MEKFHPATVGAVIKPIITKYNPEQWEDMALKACLVCEGLTAPTGAGGKNSAPPKVSAWEPARGELRARERVSENQVQATFENSDSQLSYRGRAGWEHGAELEKIDLGSLVEFEVKHTPKDDGTGVWTNFRKIKCIRGPEIPF